LKGEIKVTGEVAELTIGNYRQVITNLNPSFLHNQSVIVSVRPEEFLLTEAGEENALTAVVEDLVFLGSSTQYFIRLEDGTEAVMVNESTLDKPHQVGSQLALKLNAQKINYFSQDGSKNLLAGVDDGMGQEDMR
ncbi:MAG TPA: TOBE domain-containing protein, partial [Clostridia bacterium]|nr:TOBE domain-containing protein [Clostridia bacterium]